MCKEIQIRYCVILCLSDVWIIYYEYIFTYIQRIHFHLQCSNLLHQTDKNSVVLPHKKTPQNKKEIHSLYSLKRIRHDKRESSCSPPTFAHVKLILGKQIVDSRLNRDITSHLYADLQTLASYKSSYKAFLKCRIGQNSTIQSFKLNIQNYLLSSYLQTCILFPKLILIS